MLSNWMRRNRQSPISICHFPRRARARRDILGARSGCILARQGCLMRAFFLCVVADLTCWIGICPGGGPTEPVPPQAVQWSADLRAIADGNNQFAFDLYSRLREGSGNL